MNFNELVIIWSGLLFGAILYISAPLW